MILKTQINVNSEEFKNNFAFNKSLLNELNQKIELSKQSTNQKNADNKNKPEKLSCRERISKLIDNGSQFLELSSLAGSGLYDGIDVPCGGIVTGIGIVQGRPCMVIANDARVKGGTYFPITVKKHLRAQEVAWQNQLPCIYLVDSGGAFLPMQDEVFPDKDDFGRIFFNQARMSAAGIPQISSVHGFCTAGGAYIPAMSDQSVIVKGTGTIFLAGPPLVKAATGEDVTAEELGGAEVHTSISGVSDHFAENDEHAIIILRNIILNLGRRAHASFKMDQSFEPEYSAEELLGVIPKDSKQAYDCREVIMRLVDKSYFFEFKKNYSPTLVTGFAKLGGISIGIIANNGVLFSESALKGAHFIELCCQEKIPLLFIQNITGFIVGKQYEHGGIAKDGAKLVHAVANANIPKITLIVGGSYGAGNYGMCGRAYDPNFVFMWPNARISVMGGEQAAEVLVTVKKQQLEKSGGKLSIDEVNSIKKPILEKYANESSAYYSTARLWDDGIIDPTQTRFVLQQAFTACLNAPIKDSKFGIFRM